VQRPESGPIARCLVTEGANCKDRVSSLVVRGLGTTHLATEVHCHKNNPLHCVCVDYMFMKQCLCCYLLLVTVVTGDTGVMLSIQNSTQLNTTQASNILAMLLHGHCGSEAHWVVR